MIGRLRGILISKQPPSLLIEVGGVGYDVDAPMSTIYDLPATGKEVTLLTHYAVKEDGVALYGFLREAERAMFRHLLKVSGIGASGPFSPHPGRNCTSPTTPTIVRSLPDSLMRRPIGSSVSK